MTRIIEPRTAYDPMDGGKWTLKLGESVERRFAELNDPKLQLYFDCHHYKKEGGIVNDRIIACMDIDGLPDRATHLSFVDLAVAYGKDILVLCEVEEGHSSPKRIIGDTCNLLYADYVKVRGNRFHLSNFSFFYGLTYLKGGQGSNRAKELQKRITKSMDSVARDRMHIEIIQADTCEAMVDLLEEKIITQVRTRVGR